MALNFGGQLFPPRQEINAQYSYQDVASGTGVVEFYGIKDSDTGGVSLINQKTDVGTNSGADFDTEERMAGLSDFNEDGAMTFDTNEFQVTKILKGRVYATFAAGGTANDGVTLASIRLIQVHGAGGTTTLSSSFSIPEAVDSSATWFVNMFLDMGDISSTVIKKGDKLRLAVTSTIDGGAFMYHNPAGSAITHQGITCINTQMLVAIPFKLDL